MKLKKYFLGICTFFCLIISSPAYSSHLSSLEITYAHIGFNSYYLLAHTYVNCLAAAAPPANTLTVRARSKSLNLDILSAGTLVKRSSASLPSVIPPNLTNCYTGTSCWEEHTYGGVVNLNLLGKASDWEFIIEACCFSDAPVDPLNVSSSSFIISTRCGLNNLDFNSNDLGLWHYRGGMLPLSVPAPYTDTIINYPLKSVCVGYQNNIDVSIKELEGDIIRYELISPYTSGDTTITYNPGYSIANPFPLQSPPGLVLDSVTGILSFTAGPQDGIYLIAFKATEYGFDTNLIGGVPVISLIQKGYSIRNYMLFVEPAATCPDTTIKILGSNLSLNCKDSEFDLDVSEWFLCNSLDSDGSCISLVESVTTNSINIKSAEVLKCSEDLISKKIRITLDSVIPAGKYYLTFIKGTDGNSIIAECGKEIPENRDTIIISVDTIRASEMMGSLDSNGKALSFLTAKCGSNNITVKLSEQVKCSSIDRFGSEFYLVDSTLSPPRKDSIIDIIRYGCVGHLGRTDSLKITLADSLRTGFYRLYLRKGIDSNTLLTKCNDISKESYIELQIEDVTLDLGKDLTYCKDSVFYAVVGPTNPTWNYKWSNGQSISPIVLKTKGTYILEVDNGQGCSDIDTLVVTEIDCGTGVEQSSLSAFKLIPNPVRDILNVEFAETLRLNNIEIFDQLGKRINRIDYENQKVSKVKIRVGELNNGLYFLKTTDFNGSVSMQRFVVQKP